MAVKQFKPAKLALIGAAIVGAGLPAVAAAQWHGREDFGSIGEQHRGGRGGGGGGGGQAPQAQPPRPAPAPAPASAPQGNWGQGGGWGGQRNAAPAPGPGPGPAPAPQPQPQAGGWNGHGNWAGRPALPAPQAAPAPAPAPAATPSPRAWGYAQRGTVPPPQPGRDRNDWVNRGTAGYPYYAGRERDRWRDGDRWRGGDYRRWDNGWRHDNRYDWRGWRDYHRDWFHLGRYYPPYQGWYYRRLSVGFVLDALFWGDNYWIADPFYYHLPPAYGPYRWVRYYDDALLVDTYTGQVVDVIYGVFW